MIPSKEPLLASLYGCMHGPELLSKVHTNLPELPEQLPVLAYGMTGYLEPSVQHHEKVVIIPHLSEQHLGLGDGSMENLAFSAKSGDPIPIANHVKTIYSQYVGPEDSDQMKFLCQCERVPFGLYAGTLMMHWGHFILETLPRLVQLRAHIDRFDSAPVYFNTWKSERSDTLYDRLAKAPYAEYFRFLGLDIKRIRLIFRPIHFDSLIIGSAANVLSGHVNMFSLDSIRRLREISREMAASNQSSQELSANSSHIYFSRRSHDKPIQGRRLANEEAIENIFESKGFTIVDPGLLSSEVAKQSFLSNAKVIAGCAGSGLLNTISASQAEHIITLASPKTANANPAIHQQIQLDRACNAKSHLFIGHQHSPERLDQDVWSVGPIRLSRFLDDALS